MNTQSYQADMQSNAAECVKVLHHLSVCGHMFECLQSHAWMCASCHQPACIALGRHTLKAARHRSATSFGWIMRSGMYSASGRDQVMGLLTWAGLIVITFTLSSCSACSKLAVEVTVHR